jgi:GNAT superfamily N-acetyltransferase
MEILKTDSKNEDFRKLVELLDESLYELYGEIVKLYSKQNSVDYNIKDVVIIYNDGEPVACGAYKEYDLNTIELKRIFVKKSSRGKGLSKLIVKELEVTGKSNGYKSAVLQTGKRQVEAIKLYEKSGYELIENYGVYADDAESVCMRKLL